MESKLEIRNLCIRLRTQNGTDRLVRDVNFNLEKGKTLAIVGESGSGKTAVARTIMGLLGDGAVMESGEILYEGKDILMLDERDLRVFRGKRIAILHQDPMCGLEPGKAVGKQLCEALPFTNKAALKETKLLYKTKLKLLADAMTAALGEEGRNVSELPIRLKIFQRTIEAAARLERQYVNARECAGIALADVEALLQACQQKTAAELMPRLQLFIEHVKGARDEFVMPDEYTLDDQLKALLKQGKAGGPGAALQTPLEGMKAQLLAAFALRPPHFLALGYCKATDHTIPTGIDEDDQDRLIREIAERDFLRAFIADAAAGIRWAARGSLDARKRFIDETEGSAAILASGDEGKRKAELARIAKLAEAAIDPLVIHEDGLLSRLRNSLDRKGQEEDAALLLRRAREFSAAFIQNADTMDWTREAWRMTRHLALLCLIADKKVSKSELKAKIMRQMEEAGIPEPLNCCKQSLSALSDDMRRRAALAIALSPNPEILICDEPADTLDAAAKAEFLAHLKKLKDVRRLSVILLTRDKALAEREADSVVVLADAVQRA